MSDMWSHSHEWDNGYAKGHKAGYEQGRADAIEEVIDVCAEFFEEFCVRCASYDKCEKLVPCENFEESE